MPLEGQPNHANALFSVIPSTPNSSRALDASGLDPALLTLEITETMIMADEDEVGETLHRLKALGVRISVDDFGTGYSALGHLNAFRSMSSRSTSR